ncbi:HIT domain-containing protein [Patescibacteria group bacterium]|nr:HIT domain-containing protein [Patescibacteria group bacterium]
MEDCIFCKIINGNIPSYKIHETADFVSILDINPNVKGTTLVISKKHHASNPMEIPNEILKKGIIAAKEISKILSSKLNVERVGMAIDGTGVNHFHIKLYPFHKGESGLGEAHERVYFEHYPGYLTTQLGPQEDFSELEKLAKSF